MKVMIEAKEEGRIKVVYKGIKKVKKLLPNETQYIMPLHKKKRRGKHNDNKYIDTRLEAQSIAFEDIF